MCTTNVSPFIRPFLDLTARDAFIYFSYRLLVAAYLPANFINSTHFSRLAKHTYQQMPEFSVERTVAQVPVQLTGANWGSEKLGAATVRRSTQ